MMVGSGIAQKHPLTLEHMTADKISAEQWLASNKLFNDAFYDAFKDIPYTQLDDDIKDGSDQELRAFIQRLFEKFKTEAVTSLSRCVLAYEAERLVGYALYRLRSDAPEIIVAVLVVDSQSQGKGVGKMLLDSVAHSFPTARSMVLTCDILNQKARAFYAKQGFFEITEGVEGVHFDPKYQLALKKDIS